MRARSDFTADANAGILRKSQQFRSFYGLSLPFLFGSLLDFALLRYLSLMADVGLCVLCSERLGGVVGGDFEIFLLLFV